MKKIIFITTFVVCVLSITLTALSVSYVSYSKKIKQLKSETAIMLKMVNTGMNVSGGSFLDSTRTMQCRILHVGKQGEILFDNRYDVKNTDNISGKNSDRKAYHYSFERSDGTKIRIAVVGDKFFANKINLAIFSVFILITALSVASFLTKRITKKITRPINKINLDNPLEYVIFDELSPLMRKIRKKNLSFENQLNKLKKRKSQFEIITTNMIEGLVILDEADKIIFCNKKAINILDRENSNIDNIRNQNILVLCRDEKFLNGIKFPSEKNKSESSFEIYKRTIKMIANRILSSDKKVIGTTVLLIDITEQADREKLRREFSANVSHELKTPLTVISGYAEIISGGIVKGNEIIDFSKKIYAESQHLLTLINDIIQLSNLDENSNFEFEEVDLYDFAKDAILRIKEKADMKNISIELSGKETRINAVPRLLDEILLNLLDNATKYNREKGSITVEIKPRTASVILSVTDTGIGIPRSEQSRVFERFYRVDSSRTKRQNGTGLGLSIVKNAVQILNGKVSLSSVEGEGTKVNVRFRLAQN